MKSIITKISFVLILFLLVTSCAKMAMKMVTNMYKKPDIHYITNGEKTVAYVSMMHLNKKDFFDNTKSIVDSLRNQGYTIFYEGTKMDSKINEIVQDTIFRKVRKLIGIHLTAYDNTDNKSIQKYQIEGVISQTHNNTGINPDIDIRADIPLDSIINIYERDKGKIKLSDCDFKTSLNDKYKCSKSSKGERDYFMLTIRNRIVTNKIIDDNHNKIAIIYGLLHYKGILENLQSIDNRWQEVKFDKAM